MWPVRVSNPEPLTYESGALPTALRGPTILISRKHNTPYHPPVTTNGETMSEIEMNKHLGIIFLRIILDIEHLSHIERKPCHRINVMRKLKFVLDRKSPQTFIFWFIRTLTEYADFVWANCTQHEANELEKNSNRGGMNCDRSFCIPKLVGKHWPQEGLSTNSPCSIKCVLAYVQPLYVHLCHLKPVPT